MTTTTLTFKSQSLYVAFAPQFAVFAYGACEDEALNNLTDEIHQRQASTKGRKESQ